MTRPWTTVATEDGPLGRLELRRRGEGAKADHLLLHDGRILMNSRERGSEEALGRLVGGLAARRPRVLIGGLGMGITLRACLDGLPSDARVTVAELDPRIVTWCRGLLASVSGHALTDPRVAVCEGDLAAFLAETRDRFDAILLDLYEGPSGRTRDTDPLYGDGALSRQAAALRPGGVLGVWSEEPSGRYERRARRAGLQLERRRVGSGGRRHVLYVARAGHAR